MGFYNKKPKKYQVYSLQEAMKFIKENKGYSVVQEEGGYKIIPDSIANEHIGIYRSQIRQKEEFSKRMQEGYTLNQIGKNTQYYDDTQNNIQIYSFYDDER